MSASSAYSDVVGRLEEAAPMDVIPEASTFVSIQPRVEIFCA